MDLRHGFGDYTLGWRCLYCKEAALLVGLRYLLKEASLTISPTSRRPINISIAAPCIPFLQIKCRGHRFLRFTHAMSSSRVNVLDPTRTITIGCPYGGQCSDVTFTLSVSSMRSYWTHIKDSHIEACGKWTCPEEDCDASHSNWTKFQTHVGKHHHPLYSRVEDAKSLSKTPHFFPTVVSNSDDDDFYCPYSATCGHSSFASEADRTTHMEMDHRLKSGELQCPICWQLHTFVVSLVEHLYSLHDIDQHCPARSQYQACGICQIQGFASRHAMRAHTVEHHMQVLSERCWHPDCKGRIQFASHLDLQEHIEKGHQSVCCMDKCEGIDSRISSLCKTHLDQHHALERNRNRDKMAIGSIVNP